MYEAGRAGAYVSGQMWRQRAVAVAYGVATVVLAPAACASFAAVAYADAPPLRAAAAVAGVTALAGCGYAAAHSRRTMRQAGRSAIGARSEREARSAIRRTGSVAAAYGLVLGGYGGDCDAVVVTRGLGTAAVEVKTGHGEVIVEGDAMRVGRRVLHGDPVRQAASQARRLSRALERRPVLAVVCVPGMTNRPFAAGDGVWVCGANDLAAVLGRAPRVFDSAAEAREEMKRLWRAGTGTAHRAS